MGTCGIISDLTKHRNAIHRVILIAELHDSDYSLDGDTVIIHYPQRGMGSAITQRINMEFQDMEIINYDVSNWPNGCELQVTIR